MTREEPLEITLAEEETKGEASKDPTVRVRGSGDDEGGER